MCVCVFCPFCPDDSNSYTEDVQNKFTAVRNEEVLLPKESYLGLVNIWMFGPKTPRVIKLSISLSP